MSAFCRVAFVFTVAVLFDFHSFALRMSQISPATWGGEHIVLEVTDKGAKVDLDCAHGAIDEPLILDSNARFDSKGSYFQESPGPQREDQPAAKRARYVGRVQGETMTLTIMLIESGQTIGPFSLTKGRMPRITKCA